MQEVKNLSKSTKISRRKFIGTCAIGTAALAVTPVLSFGHERANNYSITGGASYKLSLDQNWLFGGKYTSGATDPNFNDQSFSKIITAYDLKAYGIYLAAYRDKILIA